MDTESKRLELIAKVKADLRAAEVLLEHTQIDIYMLRGALQALAAMAPDAEQEEKKAIV